MSSVGFLAAGFPKFELHRLALVKQSGAFISNRLQTKTLAEGLVNADGIRGFAIDFKNSKAIQASIGIFTTGNCAPQEKDLGHYGFSTKSVICGSDVLVGVKRHTQSVFSNCCNRSCRWRG